MAPPDDTRLEVEVEALVAQLGALKREREHLRSRDAGREELERNRRAIVDAQRELSQALIARYGPSFQPAYGA